MARKLLLQVKNSKGLSSVLIRVPKGQVIASPIRLPLTSLRNNISIILEEHSKASVVELSASKKASMTKNKISILLKANSSLDYLAVQTMGASAASIVARSSVLEKDSKLNHIDCIIGSKHSQLSSEFLLKGENSELNSYAMLLGDGEQVFDLRASSAHLAQNTKSNMLVKSILNGRARLTHQGLVRINKGSASCQGYQRSEAIMLSDEAEISTIPNLEIGNNEVSCTHAATISQVPEDKLFYLKSRGIPESQAVSLVLQGFLSRIFESIPEKEKHQVYSAIAEKTGAKHAGN
ncbi:MAG TPA: SufD family Fe-S cluster assembly protein [Candidatus Nanoarchaeia archaeon]|nr:SufD family Fe-S cluster assembly protein [Candidatus Nanoarchaeia archaeon]